MSIHQLAYRVKKAPSSFNGSVVNTVSDAEESKQHITRLGELMRQPTDRRRDD